LGDLLPCYPHFQLLLLKTNPSLFLLALEWMEWSCLLLLLLLSIRLLLLSVQLLLLLSIRLLLLSVRLLTLEWSSLQ
jgi:hypothetical protein